jgi:hypothetical protein
MFGLVFVKLHNIILNQMIFIPKEYINYYMVLGDKKVLK